MYDNLTDHIFNSINLLAEFPYCPLNYYAMFARIKDRGPNIGL